MHASKLLRPVALAALAALLLAVASIPAALGATRIVPAIGSYVASGQGDPPRYAVRAQVTRRAGHTKISVQVRDTCGGFATFRAIRVRRASNGSPVFSSQIGAARVRGRWTAATRIVGKVRTPCASAQGYAMHLLP